MPYIYQLQKSDLKILRYVYSRKTVALSKLQNEFSSNLQQLDNLINQNYLITDYMLPKDSSGFPIGEYPPDTLYYLSNSSVVEIENRQWFDGQFVIRNIVLPIILAVITTLITVFLSSWLLPYR